ncbi:prenyltransferase/squalene oxidase repeat-containing protein [Tautonia rosea]|uniref:prenyltransferase/squalene oxidase repeat-containing protein n=1 Tax=Tautonia rosea TaxID=2728037 RepID=UPI0014731F87|nr:prenyltransferase/squalene oxidase repeat-containing protein [Tautonia rosea]
MLAIPCSILILILIVAQPGIDPEASPEQRAIAYLAQEVPRWRSENGCASCHHNGDGAHALFRASLLGFDVPQESLADSVQWLLQPADWDKNGGQGTFNDQRLARIQFARSLAGAVDAGLVEERRSALTLAADQLAADQEPDGSWPIDGPDSLGTPATYGSTLTTFIAREVLSNTDPDRYRSSIAAADRWLLARPIRTTLDASVSLLHQHATDPDELPDRARQALDLLDRSQAPEGGWGPYETSPPEVFDTALAVLALARTSSKAHPEDLLRGRSYLVATQLPSGGWPETTRPSGNESDAQHFSTTAWATLALLATRDGSRNRGPSSLSKR